VLRSGSTGSGTIRVLRESEAAPAKLTAARVPHHTHPTRAESTLGHNIDSPLGPRSLSDLESESGLTNSTHTDYMWTSGASDAQHSSLKSETSFERVDSAGLSLLYSSESSIPTPGLGSSPTAPALEGAARQHADETKEAHGSAGHAPTPLVPKLMFLVAEAAAETQEEERCSKEASSSLDAAASVWEAGHAKGMSGEQARLNSARTTDSVLSGATTARRPNTARMLHLKAPSRGSAGFEDYALQQRHETPIHADSSGKAQMLKKSVL